MGSVGEAQLSVNRECVKLLSQTLKSPSTQAPRKKYLWVQACYIQLDNQPSSSDHKNRRSVPALYPPPLPNAVTSSPALRSPTSTDSCHLRSLLLSHSVPPHPGHTGFLAAFWTWDTRGMLLSQCLCAAILSFENILSQLWASLAVSLPACIFSHKFVSCELPHECHVCLFFSSITAPFRVYYIFA